MRDVLELPSIHVCADFRDVVVDVHFSHGAINLGRVALVRDEVRGPVREADSAHTFLDGLLLGRATVHAAGPVLLQVSEPAGNVVPGDLAVHLAVLQQLYFLRVGL